jgi:aminoglycoside phosphotransferase (APT) family kinase protein
MGREAEVEMSFLADTGRVAQLIAAKLPALRGLDVIRLGEGWDHAVFAAGDQWIVRFPKRARRVPWLEREVLVLAAVAHSVSTGVPRLEHFVAPSAECPFPFAAYRRIPGVGADRGGVSDPLGLAADVGRMLDALHRVDPDLVPPTPAGWERLTLDDERLELVAEIAGVAETAGVTALLGGELADRAEEYLTGVVPPPARDAAPRFVHNDICPDHLIIDPARGRLNGVIDFSDAMVGDPVVDFVGLVGLGGRSWVDQALAHYRLPLGQGFAETWEWLARTLTLRWLSEAIAEDPAQIPKHVRWVENAFATAG